MRYGSDILPWYMWFGEIRANHGIVEIRMFWGKPKAVRCSGTLETKILALENGKWYRPWDFEIDE